MARLDTRWRGGQVKVVQGRLAVAPDHEVAWSRAGQGGIPVVCLDPGETHAFVRRLFDPTRFDLTVFERRGGVNLADNTMSAAIADLETLRSHLGVTRWIVAGQGRGATLGLSYAQTHPGACAGLLLTGIMMGRARDADWWWDGPEALFPEIWHEFRQSAADIEAFRARCFSDAPGLWHPAGLAAMMYEAQIADIRANPDRMNDLAVRPDHWAARGRLNMHFDTHRHFLAENALIDRLDAVRGIPAALLHGRYDSVAPVSGSFDLSRAWPEARFHIVPGAAHGWYDEKMYEAVMMALDAVARPSFVAGAT